MHTVVHTRILKRKPSWRGSSLSVNNWALPNIATWAWSSWITILSTAVVTFLYLYTGTPRYLYLNYAIFLFLLLLHEGWNIGQHTIWHMSHLIYFKLAAQMCFSWFQCFFSCGFLVFGKSQKPCSMSRRCQLDLGYMAHHAAHGPWVLDVATQVYWNGFKIH